jgi:hypothetical protein
VYDITIVRRASPPGELVSIRQAMERLLDTPTEPTAQAGV